MMSQFAQLYPAGLIRYTQSTYLELVTDTEVHRVDFVGKLSCHLQRSTRGAVSFHYTHPLLRGSQGTLVTLMARATTRYLDEAALLRAALQEEIRRQAGDWYDFAPATWSMWWHRLAEHNFVPDLPRTGGIILSSVPLAVAQAAADVCTRYGVETYLLPPPQGRPTPPPRPQYQLLLIGRSYVIARSFFVSTLLGNPSARQAPRFLKKFS